MEIAELCGVRNMVIGELRQSIELETVQKVILGNFLSLDFEKRSKKSKRRIRISAYTRLIPGVLRSDSREHSQNLQKVAFQGRIYRAHRLGL